MESFGIVLINSNLNHKSNLMKNNFSFRLARIFFWLSIKGLIKLWIETSKNIKDLESRFTPDLSLPQLLKIKRRKTKSTNNKYI